MDKQFSKLVSEGISDAVGFVGGALAGYWAGKLLGLDVFSTGYGNASIMGIVLVGLGGGAGLHLARFWRSKQTQKSDTDDTPT
jgi:predicted lipid-binding transport protein (Tim44 family)